jgi:LPS sulfotransferase NodH
MEKNISPDYQPICVITSARSGSNWLMSILDTAPQVIAHSELFHRFNIYSEYYNYSEKKFLSKVAAIALRNLNPIRFLNRLFEQTKNEHPNARHIIFKLFWYHNQRVLRHVIENDKFRIIVLERKNKLEQYSSRKLALKTGQWVFGDNNSRNSLIDFDLTDFLRYVHRMHTGEEKIKEMLHDREYFFLHYEDIDEKIDELADWLGVAAADLRTKGSKIQKKQNKAKALERFSNPDQVRNDLAGTEWAKYLG